MLRAKERLPQVRPGNTRYDGRYQIPTLQEVIDLVRAESRRLGRRIGLYPETKHPTYFDGIGRSLEEPLVRALRKNGLAKRGSAVFIQSFETGNLRELDRLIDVPLVQLVDAAGAPYDLVAAGDPRTYSDPYAGRARAIARYADGVGVAKGQDRAAGRRRARPGAHTWSATRTPGLLVHVWTFRNENNSSRQTSGGAPTRPRTATSSASTGSSWPSESTGCSATTRTPL